MSTNDAPSSSSTSPTETTTNNNNNGTEEGIMVAIRMRPLNSRESSSSPTSNKSSSRVWRVLQKYNSISQCTPTGKPLPERIVNRNFFTYDKTFGESSTTRQVYDNVARDIVQSTVSDGKNGTIFAYGQTSSGKTFTMQGSGSIEDGSSGGSGGNNNGGGIVHMAARDIFQHIEQDTERVFLVRVSFIEIYNEEVRDLLVTPPSSTGDGSNNGAAGGGGGSGGATLTIREDKQRGVFVNSNETIVTSIDGLLSVLFAGEKNRHVGSTAMNERSSRSHTIFRITVESRLNHHGDKDGGDSDEDEDDASEEEEEEDVRMGGTAAAGHCDGNGAAVRVSTLNLVDLAGSESVRHTGATGDRQKEGVKINLSLLTLSRVISNLGQGAAHINFRDSKLTRILQPSLSGNARMAVICCATPSDLYLEETRSTLQFASRAKLVKTRAQVNEVMDDRSLIKKLQRELKEARRGGPGKETMEQMKALEEKAASAEDANRKAEQDLKRMKEMLLKGGVLNVGVAAKKTSSSSGSGGSYVYNGDDGTIRSMAIANDSHDSSKKGRSKRRYSDGIINDNENGDPQLTSPLRNGTISQKQAHTEMKAKKLKPSAHILAKDKTDNDDVMLLREALTSKSSQAAELKARLEQVQQEVEATRQKLEYETGEKEMIRMAKHDLESQVSTLASDKDFAIQEQDIIIAEKDGVIASSMAKIETLTHEKKEQAQVVSDLEAQVESLRDQLATKETEYADQVRTLNDAQHAEKEESNLKIAEMEGDLEKANSDNAGLVKQVEELSGSLSEAKAEKDSLQAEFDETVKTMNSDFEKSTAEHEQKASELSADVSKLTEERDSLQSTLDEKEQRIVELEESVQSSNAEMDDKTAAIESLESEKTELEDKVGSLQISMEELTTEVGANKTSLAEAEATIATLREESTSSNAKIDELMKEVNDLKKEKEVLEARVEYSDAALSGLESTTAAKLVEAEAKIEEQRVSGAQSEEEKRELEELVANLRKDLSTESEAKEALQLQVQEKDAALNDLQNQYDEAVSTIEKLGEEKSDLETKASGLETEIASLKDTVATLDESLQVQQLTVQDLEAQLEVAENDVVRLSEENNASNQTNQDLETNLSEMANAKETIEASVVDLETKLESVSQERDTAQSRVTELMSGNGNLEQIMQSIQTEKDDLASKLEEANENIKMVEESKEELLANLEAAIAERDNMKAEQSKMESEQNAKLAELSEAIEGLKDRITSLTSELENSKADHDWTKSQMEELQTERDTLQARVEELLSGNTNSQEVLSALGAEKEALSSELKQASSQLEAKDFEISGLVGKVEGLTNDISALNAEKAELQSQLEAIATEHEQCSSILESVMAEKESLASTIITDAESKYSAEIAQLNSSIEEKSKEISRLGEEIAELKAKAAEPAVDSAAVEEIQELKSLLASANDSVNEARSSAALADQELERKELELEETLRKLEEEEEARRLAEDKAMLAQQSPRNSSKRESEEELLKEMEILMGEKIDAESRLEQELKKRKEFEDGLKKSAEEEKQQLVEEAEERMVSLRDKISQLQSDLSRAESECYNMKDENNDLRDRYERAEVKAADTESIVTSMTDELRREQEQKNALEKEVARLKEESDAFKSQVYAAKESFEAQAYAKVAELESNLSGAMSRLSRSEDELKRSNETIAHLTSDIEEYKNALASTKSMAIGEKEMEISKLKEELATAKLNLQTSEAGYLSAKRELEDAKESVEKIRRHEHAKRQELASKAEATVNALKTRLETATAAATSGGDGNSREVDELKSTIREKDARIQKLEKAKITRAQIEQITKLKDERRQFKDEAENYKQRLAALENDSERGNGRRGLRERVESSQDQSREIAKLQDDLQQCEDKLRKYVQHSERLESDRKGVMDAVASYNIGEIVGGNVVETVASICERLASVEDECNALAQSEKKAVQYLTELDSLRERFDKLESELQDCLGEKEKLISQLEESEDNLNKCEGKIAELVKDQNSLQALAENAKHSVSELQSEKRRQMQFLENENLQLGEELKRAKKELQLTKTALEAAQKQAFGGEEQTQELVGFSSLLSGQAQSANKKPPLQPTKTNFGTPSKSARKRPGGENVHNEENALNGTSSKKLKSSTSKSPFRPSSSSKKLNPFSSLKKSAKKSARKKLSDDSPTKLFLSEDGNEPTADLTSECKQS